MSSHMNVDLSINQYSVAVGILGLWHIFLMDWLDQ